MILATIKQINQKQLILVRGEDSKKGQLIYLMRKGSFQVILYKIITFLSGKLKKHTKLAKIVKISIFVNWLIFHMNFNQFNRFSHPMTINMPMWAGLNIFAVQTIWRDRLLGMTSNWPQLSNIRAKSHFVRFLIEIYHYVSIQAVTIRFDMNGLIQESVHLSSAWFDGVLKIKCHDILIYFAEL